MCLGGIKIIGMTSVSHKATDVSKPCPIPKPPPQQRLGRTQLVPGNLTIRPIGRGLEIFRALRSNSTTLLPCKMVFIVGLDGWDWKVFNWQAVVWKSMGVLLFSWCPTVYTIRFYMHVFCGCCYSRDVFFFVFFGGKIQETHHFLCWFWAHD